MFNLLFSKIIIKSQINDQAAKEIEKCFERALECDVRPTYNSFRDNIKAKCEYIICTNCNSMKNSVFCNTCQCKTENNYYTLFDVESQLNSILENEIDTMLRYRDNIGLLGYHKESVINKVHEKTGNFTLALNTDGVCVYRKRTKDTWPIYLVINELPVPKKFSLSNVILAGLWVGRSKINNKIVLNDTMKYLSTFEQTGVEYNHETYKFSVIFGSFDKPASALILNTSYFNSEFGCRYCLAKRTTLNRKPCFLNPGKKRTHFFQIAKGIEASNSNKPVMGLRGISCLR